MKNEQVIKNFLEGYEGKTPLHTISGSYHQGRTLYTKGNKLINYSTTIAYIENNTLHLNITKYSATTSKIQTMIDRLSRSYGYTPIYYEG